MILASLDRTRIAGSVGGGENILEKVEEPPPSQELAKGRFYAARIFVSGSQGLLILKKN
jgi:hypothetical protein